MRAVMNVNVRSASTTRCTVHRARCVRRCTLRCVGVRCTQRRASCVARRASSHASRNPCKYRAKRICTIHASRTCESRNQRMRARGSSEKMRARKRPGGTAPNTNRHSFSLSAPVRMPFSAPPGPIPAVARHAGPCGGRPPAGPALRPGGPGRTRPNVGGRGRPPGGKTRLLGPRRWPTSHPRSRPAAPAATWSNVRGVGGAGRITGAGGMP